MNIDALRAFLHVAQSGSFTRAAARLGVMQSTVSARIQTLESAIGHSLFSRSRSGTALTRAGHDLRAYAESIVRAWDQAQQQIALPAGLTASFCFGGPVALQDRLTVAWVTWMRANAPYAALRIESGSSETLSGALASGMMDAALMYLPQQRTGLVLEQLLIEDLMLVRDPELAGAWQDSFIAIDWGFAFLADFAKAFPDVPSSALSVGAAALALRHLHELKGAAYLPRSFVQPLLQTGELQAVPDVPVFQRPVFLVYPAQPRNAALLELALRGLRMAVIAVQAGP